MATATTSMPTATGRRTESVTRLMADLEREETTPGVVFAIVGVLGKPLREWFPWLRTGLQHVEARAIFEAALSGDDHRLAAGEPASHFDAAVARIPERDLAAPGPR